MYIKNKFPSPGLVPERPGTVTRVYDSNTLWAAQENFQSSPQQTEFHKETLSLEKF